MRLSKFQTPTLFNGRQSPNTRLLHAPTSAHRLGWEKYVDACVCVREYTDTFVVAMWDLLSLQHNVT